MDSKTIEIAAASTFIVTLLIAGIYTLVYRSESKAYIEDMSWERHIIVEEYKTLIEEGWGIPIGGRELDRWQEQRGTESYICGEEWNTTTEQYDDVYCEMPVYDTKYRYEIDKWIYSYTLLTKGSNREPYWHNVSDLNYTVKGLDIGDERLGPRNEFYRLHFVIDNKEAVYTTNSIDEWLAYEIEHPVILTRNILGHIIAVRKAI